MIMQGKMQEDLYFSNKCFYINVFYEHIMKFDLFNENLNYFLYCFVILIKHVPGHSFKFWLGQYKRLVRHCQNGKLFYQIFDNLSYSSKLEENLTLFNKARDNIMILVNKLNENVPDQMKHMPPLPEKLNDDLFKFLVQNQIYHSYHE